MNSRLAPPTSSRRVLTRDSSRSLVPFPSTSPVIGMATKSLSSSVGWADTAGGWNTQTAHAKHATLSLLDMVWSSTNECPLEARDAINFDQRVPGDPSWGGDCSPNRRILAETSKEHVVHSRIVLEIVEIDIDLQDFVH